MRRITYVLVISMMCLGLGILIGLIYGPASLTIGQLWEALMHSGEKSPEIIVWQLRMPRVAIALVVGASLATAGALLQISARNPLGDPQIFGVGGGATIAQAMALAGWITSETWSLTSISVVFSVIGVSIITYFSARQDITSARLALIGVSVAALSLAIATGIMASARIFTQQSLTFIGGSFTNRGWDELVSALPFVLLGLGLTALIAGRLNLLNLGDEIAHNLGANPSKTRLLAMIAASILGGIAVSLSGLVGFVGLLVPHIARIAVGHDARSIILVSIPLGATLTLYADQVARLAFMPAEVPVGMVTTALGAPLMIYIARRVT